MKVTALIMAGKRSGVLDPLAKRAGVAQKCVVPVRGKPMIQHVVEAVAGCDRIGAIHVVAHEPDEIADIPIVEALQREGRLHFKPGAFNLVDSVFAGAEGAKAFEEEAGAAAALARKEDVIAADPVGQKKFYEFTDGGYSNCNTYWIGSPDALSAAEIMRTGGQFVKYPSRIAKAFGLINLIRFYFGWGDKDKLFEGISRRFGYKLVPIVLSNGEFAIDVDEERSFGVTEKLLAKRESAAA